jgi:hypothetical protein
MALRRAATTSVYRSASDMARAVQASALRAAQISYPPATAINTMTATKHAAKMIQNLIPTSVSINASSARPMVELRGLIAVSDFRGTVIYMRLIGYCKLQHSWAQCWKRSTASDIWKRCHRKPTDNSCDLVRVDYGGDLVIVHPQRAILGYEQKCTTGKPSCQ